MGFKINTYAYTVIGENEIQAYSANTTIVYADNPTTNWYKFTISFNRQYSAQYILFSSFVNLSTVITDSSSNNLAEVLLSSELTKTKNEWYFYLGSSVTTYYVWIYTPGGGAAAQAQLQSYIDNNWYYYYNISATTKNDTIMAFVQRYWSLNDNEIYNSGFGVGYIEGYNEGFENGSDQSFSVGYDEGYNVGYDEGLSADLNVAPLFTQLITHIGSVFGLVIFPGVTIGTLVSIPIAFALFKWFMKIFGGK